MYNRFLKMYVGFKTFSGSRKGQAMTEYGIIIAVIAVVLIVVLIAIGGRLLGVFGKVRDALPEVSTPK